MSATWLKEGVVSADVDTWHNTRSSDERCADVGHDISVQVRHDHDVELLWFGDELHRCVVYDHVVEGNSRALILLRDASARVQEKTIT